MIVTGPNRYSGSDLKRVAQMLVQNEIKDLLRTNKFPRDSELVARMTEDVARVLTKEAIDEVSKEAKA